MIKTPNSNDILCGKDKTYARHPGNQIYRALINEKAAEYAASTNKQDKMTMTKEIVAQMEAEGSRFLRQASSGSSHCWEEISNQQARDKTSHALRFCAASLQKKQSKSKGNARGSIRKQQQQYPRPQTKAKKEHRRTVSRDSRVEFASTVAEDVIFQRQQEILAASSYHHLHHHQYDDNVCDVDQHQHSMVVPLDCTSDDLDEILREPLTTQDWDGLFVLS